MADSLGGAIGIVWSDGLRPAMRQAKAKTLNAAWITAQSMTPAVENYMKINAPWTDRTGNARNGLAARPYKDGDDVGIVLFHQVSYGVFLETAHGQRYQIINPAIETMGPQVMARFSRLLDRI